MRRAADCFPDRLRPRLDLRVACELVVRGGVDRDREGADATRRRCPSTDSSGTSTESLRGESPSSRSVSARKLSAPPSVWKPTRSAPSSPSMICRRHGSCTNSSDGGNGMCRKKPIRRSGRTLAQHRRHQLQLVVVHPDGGTAARPPRGGVGEPLVDARRTRPPVPVVRRSARRRRGRAARSSRCRSPRSTPRPRPAPGRPRAGRRSDARRWRRHRDRVVDVVPAPADPDRRLVAQHRLHRGDEPAGGRVQVAWPPSPAWARPAAGCDHEEVVTWPGPPTPGVAAR